MFSSYSQKWRSNFSYQLCLSMLLVLSLSSCSSLNQSIKARKLLAKCTYQIKELHLKTLDIAPVIQFNNSSKKISVDQPKVADLLLLANQIRKGDFKLNFDNISVDVLLEVNNPNKENVELDSMFFDLFLDESFLMNVGHHKHSLIPAQATQIVPVTVQLPIAFPLNQLLNAKEMSISGKAWLKMNITKTKQFTLPVPVEITKEIPRDEINEAINKEKEKVVKELIKNLDKDSDLKNLKDGAKKLFGF